MSGFIETFMYETEEVLVNVDAIETLHRSFDQDSQDKSCIVRWRRPFEQTRRDGSLVDMSMQYNEDEINEPYEVVREKILALFRAKEEKRNLPPTPPIKSKEETVQSACVYNPARACEENLTCEGMVVPTLDEVKAAAPGLGVDAETAEDFWLNCEGTGWKYKGDTILNWRSMLKSWHRSRKHNAQREAKRTAHIDAKMDEREAKRERRMGGRRKADNNVEMTDDVREEVRRDFSF